jgi:hypothetical protein
VGTPHQSGSNEIAEAVVSPVDGDIWAIGYQWAYVGGVAEFRALAEHDVGHGFSVVPMPDRETAPARDFLYGAASSSARDIWAVGTSVGSGSPDQTLVEHWDGTTWKIVTSPDPGPFGNDLQAVTAVSSRDVWAVGARMDGFYQTPLAVHWNGTRWSSSPVPNAAGCTGHSILTGVTAVGSRSVWATGWCGSGGTTPDRAYVVHWDGSTWSPSVVFPQSTAPSAESTSISATSDHNVWVVGSSVTGTNGATTSLTAHFDGTRWTVGAGPPDALGLAGVEVRASRVWAVGDGTSPQPPFAGPAAGRLTAHGWTDRPLPASVPFGRLYSVTSSPSGTRVWAVGLQIVGAYDTVLAVERTGS